jgi:hypothetical protein
MYNLQNLRNNNKNDEFLNKELFEDNPFIVNNPLAINNSYIVNNTFISNKGLKRKYSESTCDNDDINISDDIPQIKIEYIEKYIEELSIQLTPSKTKYDIQFPQDIITPCTTPTRAYIQKTPNAPKKNYIRVLPNEM